MLLQLLEMSSKVTHNEQVLPFHGHWRQIGRLYGPFDAAFLPINGITQPKDIFPLSDQPLDMTPVQAVEAARLLNAKLAIPIHYGRKPTTTYVEVPHPEQTFKEEAKERNQPFEIVQPNNWITWKAQ